MGFALCTSACFGCGRLFSYNPMRVPSVRVDGQREPICQGCVERVNPMRIANGVPPIVPFPMPMNPAMKASWNDRARNYHRRVADPLAPFVADPAVRTRRRPMVCAMTLIAILGASFLISLAFPVFGILLIAVGGALIFVVIMAELIRAVGRSFGFRVVFEHKPPPLPDNVVRFPRKLQR